MTSCDRVTDTFPARPEKNGGRHFRSDARAPLLRSRSYDMDRSLVAERSRKVECGVEVSFLIRRVGRTEEDSGLRRILKINV